MSQNTLLEKIKADAEAEVAIIKQAGQAQVEAISRETERQLAEMCATHKAALEKKMAQFELVAVAKAGQEGRIALQRAKRAEIDALFNEVSEELIAQPADQYVAYFAKLAASILPKSIAVVGVVAPATRITETKDILTLLGYSAEISTDNRLKAGFVLNTIDGVYDVTLDRLISERRAELEMEIVKKVTV